MGAAMMTGRQMFVRTALTVSLPLILILALVGTLLHEMRSAFWFAWQEVRLNVAAYRDHMRWDD
jgi:hypothetical protein